MKLFGFSLFEDDPHVTAYLSQVNQREEEMMRLNCENESKGLPFVALPNLDLWDFRVNGVPASKKQRAAGIIRMHREYAEQKQCHYFSGRKYCYHTGFETVTPEP